MLATPRRGLDPPPEQAGEEPDGDCSPFHLGYAVSAPVQVALALLGLIVSARIRLTLTMHGAAVSVPLLWLVAAVLVLALAALVLWLARLLLRDGLRLRPVVVTT